MKSVLFLAFFLLSCVLGCHISCTCAQDSNVCISCTDLNSSLDQNSRSCPCNDGYFTKSLNPFACEQYIQLDNNGNDISVVMDACHLEIALKASQFRVKMKSLFANINDISFINSDVYMDFSNVSISQTCIELVETFLEYTENGIDYIQFPPQYVSDEVNGSKNILLPLIDIFDLAISNTYGVDQITQIIHFQLLIGHSDQFVRQHRWDLIIYTNRNEVETFVVDINSESSSGCEITNECIVVADQDVSSFLCQDATCSTPKLDNSYSVGDMFYAKIKFVDPTYTKFLKLESVYFKNENNQIYNYSPISIGTWDNGGLVINFIIDQTSTGAIVQINMKISNTATLRQLLETDRNQSQFVQLKIMATENKISNNDDSITSLDNDNANANSTYLLTNFFAILFFYFII